MMKVRGKERDEGYEKFGFRPAPVLKSVRESPKVVSLYLKTSDLVVPDPGQFFMVWAPGAEEVPIGASGFERGVLRISVARAGPTTAKICRFRRGDTLFLRGPFGRGFSLKGRRLLLVAGGYGAAPLVYAARRIAGLKKECAYLIGAKTRKELVFLREVRELGMEVITATEDGSSGFKGMVTEILPKVLDRGKFDSVLTCGPEPMMFEVVRESLERGLAVQASLERYMKCGFGVCGSCVLDPVGARVCVDGPVFDGDFLMGTDFGRWERDECGRRVRI